MYLGFRQSFAQIVECSWLEHYYQTSCDHLDCIRRTLKNKNVEYFYHQSQVTVGQENRSFSFQLSGDNGCTSRETLQRHAKLDVFKKNYDLPIFLDHDRMSEQAVFEQVQY